MVVFVCSTCNSSLKIVQVAIHSCNAKFSCYSCNEEFNKQDVKNHVKCISEAEKYKGIDFNVSKNENKNIEKRNEWCNVINEFFNTYKTTDKNLQKIISSIRSRSNIPDKEKSFLNFIKNISHSNVSKYDKLLWSLISPLKDTMKKQQSNLKDKQFDVSVTETQKRKADNKPETEGLDNKKVKLDHEFPETKKKNKKVETKNEVKNDNENKDKIVVKEPKGKKTKKSIISENKDIKDSEIDFEKQTKLKGKKVEKNTIKINIGKQNKEEEKAIVQSKSEKNKSPETVAEIKIQETLKSKSKKIKKREIVEEKMEIEEIKQSNAIETLNNKENETFKKKRESKKKNKLEIVEEKMEIEEINFQIAGKNSEIVENHKENETVEKKVKSKKHKKLDKEKMEIDIENIKEKKSKSKKNKKPKEKMEIEEIKSTNDEPVVIGIGKGNGKDENNRSNSKKVKKPEFSDDKMEIEEIIEKTVEKKKLKKNKKPLIMDKIKILDNSDVKSKEGKKDKINYSNSTVNLDNGIKKGKTKK